MGVQKSYPFKFWKRKLKENVITKVRSQLFQNNMILHDMTWHELKVRRVPVKHEHVKRAKGGQLIPPTQFTHIS